MANIKSAKKRARQNVKLRNHNAARRSMMRTYVKHVVNALEKGDLEGAKAAFVKAQPVLDKAANKGLIHHNTAARKKSRLVAKLKQLASA